MASEAPGVLLPETVSERLASAPEVQLVAGPEGEERSARLQVAPFDDLLVLFVHPESLLLRELLRSPRASVLASGEDWQLRMDGRAVCAGRVNAHPRRLELQPWLPEGSSGAVLRAVEFYPEHIFYSDRSGGAPRTFHGETPLRVPRLAERWAREAYGGLWGLLGAGMVASWLWFGWFGQELRGRDLGLFVSLLTIPLLLGGARLLQRAAAFRCWQEGLGPRRAAGLLGRGWLSWSEVRWAGSLALLLGALGLLLLAGVWSPSAALLSFLASGSWFLGPAWWLRLAHCRRERRAARGRTGYPRRVPRDRASR